MNRPLSAATARHPTAPCAGLSLPTANCGTSAPHALGRLALDLANYRQNLTSSEMARSLRWAAVMKKILVCVIGLSAVGCAHQPPPNDQIASSLAAVRGAEEAGAMNVPEAALHVKLAQEEIEQAKKLVANDDNERP